MIADKKIALFDFDGTLINGDSFIMFSKMAIGRGNFLWATVRALPWLAAWKLGFIPGGKAKEHLFGIIFRGMDKNRFMNLGRQFATLLTNSEHYIREDITELLTQKVADGWEVYVATASLPQWVEPYVLKLGVKKVIATEAEISSDNRLTGRFLTANCCGLEKKRRIMEEIEDIEDAEIWAYGNMPDDAEMLSLAEYPVIV